MDDLDDLHDAQRRKVEAAEGDERVRLIERYRERNRQRQLKAKKKRERDAEWAKLRTSTPSGRYGPGTGRGAIPSNKQIRDAQNSPTLLEQLRRDGRSRSKKG